MNYVSLALSSSILRGPTLAIITENIARITGEGCLADPGQSLMERMGVSVRPVPGPCTVAYHAEV